MYSNEICHNLISYCSMLSQVYVTHFKFLCDSKQKCLKGINSKFRGVQ